MNDPILRKTVIPSTQCFFCRGEGNVQVFHFPCDCHMYSHPDCYAEYTIRSRRKIEGHYKIQCVNCLKLCKVPEHTSVQINIPNDDEFRPLTKREMRCEQYKIGAAMTAQCLLMIGIMGFISWGYYQIAHFTSYR